MNEATRNLLKQIPETIRRPGRLFKIGGADQRRYLTRLMRRFYLQVFHRPEAPRWENELEGGLSGRSFSTYEEYLALQRSKLESINLTDYEAQFRKALSERLRTLLKGRGVYSALCLAARLGTEVRAFQDAGVFAVGIDLNPGISNSGSVEFQVG